MNTTSLINEHKWMGCEQIERIWQFKVPYIFQEKKTLSMNPKLTVSSSAIVTQNELIILRGLFDLSLISSSETIMPAINKLDSIQR